jgi:hypothetical protein
MNWQSGASYTSHLVAMGRPVTLSSRRRPAPACTCVIGVLFVPRDDEQTDDSPVAQ